jgi:hypothetical protein
LDHIIAVNERHLKRLLFDYVRYHHEDRAHLGLGKGTPVGRICSANAGGVISHDRLSEGECALRPGGRVLVETNHRDLLCAFISRASKASVRLPDGTLFIDDPDFDAISGVVSLNWYWSGPNGSGEACQRALLHSNADCGLT